MYIKFKELELLNFRSFKDRHNFSFSDKGITIINGNNGSGKSSLIEAMYWTLTGKLVKQGKIDSAISEGCKNMATSLLISKGEEQVRIVRSYGSKKSLQLYINDVASTHLHKKDIQESIYSLLNITENSISNTLFFNQNSKRLLDASQTERKNVLSELFNLQVLDAAKDKARLRLNEYQKSLTENEYIISSVKDKLESAKSNLINTNRHNELLLSQKESRINDAIKELNEFEFGLTSIVAPEMPSKVTAPTLDDNSTLITTYKEDIASIKAEIRYDKTNLARRQQELEYCASVQNCNICGKQISNQTTIDSIRNDISTLDRKVQNNIDTLNSKELELTKASNKQKQYDKQHSEYQSYLIRLDRYNDKLEIYTDRLANQEARRKNLQDRIEKIKQENTLLLDTVKIKNDIFDLGKTLENLDTKAKEIQSNLEASEFWVKKGFTGNGLLAYILKSKVNELNTIISSYSYILDIDVRFEVITEGKTKQIQTITSINGIDREYEWLSGGEKARANLLVSLSLSKLLSGTMNANLLIFDEAFYALDEKGYEGIITFISEIAKDKEVIIITHNLDIAEGRKVLIEKINNKSKITR